MFSTVFLCGVITLLCLIAVNLAAYKHRLFKEGRSRRLGLHRFFWAGFFLPMAIVTISNIGYASPVLVNFITVLRNPFAFLDLTVGAVVQVGEISFLMDFITAILVSSAVAYTLTSDSSPVSVDVRGMAKRSCKNKEIVTLSEREEVFVPYIEFCRILS